ncbi:hypothetical protein CORC01_10511 [Colletotrichum orchidophilum]|uniref:Uncharacterized protein n=1 Tax=Colletotrichum orchidophilum TaxID=1209926 RepID=A0A1G4AYL8_9PEZI|nr:uncharacterized protein CORC01_10511 [Colletotrichum orchidophilum]OHE94173.1 hypothetical protein CORC01_10511 [Colletotrichum orchidophilum]
MGFLSSNIAALSSLAVAEIASVPPSAHDLSARQESGITTVKFLIRAVSEHRFMNAHLWNRDPIGSSALYHATGGENKIIFMKKLDKGALRWWQRSTLD